MSQCLYIDTALILYIPCVIANGPYIADYHWLSDRLIRFVCIHIYHRPPNLSTEEKEMFKRQYTAVPTTELEEGAGDSDLSSYESDSDDGDGDYSMDSLEEKTRGDASIATYKRMAIACGLVGGTMYLMLQAGAVIHHRVNGGGHGGGAGDLASSASQEAVATAASLVAVNATTPSPTPAPTPSPTPGPKCTLDDFVHGLWHQTEDAQEAKGEDDDDHSLYPIYIYPTARATMSSNGQLGRQSLYYFYPTPVGD